MSCNNPSEKCGREMKTNNSNLMSEPQALLVRPDYQSFVNAVRSSGASSAQTMPLRARTLRRTVPGHDAASSIAQGFRRGTDSRLSLLSHLRFVRSAIADLSRQPPIFDFQNGFSPARRQALRFLGQSVVVGGGLILNQDYSAAFQEVEGEGRRKDIRLKIANGQERADLIRHWNKSDERDDLSKWFKDEGYDKFSDGLEFILVYERNQFVRSAAAQIWKKGGRKRGGVYLSLEGNRDEWYGITFNGENAKTLLKVKKKGEIRETEIRRSNSLVASEDSVIVERQDSAGCDACEVGCTLGASGWLVVAGVVCYMSCGVETLVEPSQISNCVAGCTLAVATGTTLVEKCPELCENGGFC